MSPPDIPGWSLDRELGHGADATVWLARPTAGGEAVALKVIPLARLRDPAAHLREAWAAGSTGSRFVVAVLDAGQHGEFAWLAMEPATGDAAALATRAGGRLKPSTAARIARDVARGLQALADHGFVHRDVKPSNILMRPDGTAMIGDLAPLRGGGTATRSADLSGTPAYLSPEQVHGRVPDARSDVHALGATMFALIADRPPFAADTTLELLRTIAETPAPDLRTLVPEVPPAIAAVIATALAKDPALRQQRAALLAADLDEALAGRTPSRVAAPAVRVATAPAEPFAWPVWLPVAAAGVALLLGLIIGVVAARPSTAALAAEVSAVESDASTSRERAAILTQAALLADLRTRLDKLRLVRDRLALGPPPTATSAKAPVPTQLVIESHTSALAPNVVEAVPFPVPMAAMEPPVLETTPAAPAPPALLVAPPAPLPPDHASWKLTWDLPDAAKDPSTDIPILAIHPLPLPNPDGISWSQNQPDHVLVWTSNAIHLSADGGISWRPVYEKAARGTNSMPGRSANWAGPLVFVPTGDSGAFGLLSRDGGQNFLRIAKPTTANGHPSWYGRRCMLADGTLAASFRLGNLQDRLLLSRDVGVSWVDEGGFGNDTRFAYVFSLGGTVGMVRDGSGQWQGSRDRGAAWAGLGTSEWYHMAAFAHGGAQYILLGPTLLRWDTKSLQRSEVVPPLRKPMAMVLDPRDPLHLVIGGRDGLARSRDGGRTWTPLARQLPEGGILAMDLVGRTRPRLAAVTAHSLLVIDLAADLAGVFSKDAEPGTPIP